MGASTPIWHHDAGQSPKLARSPCSPPAVLPIRDINPIRRTPWITWALIGLNLSIFVYEWSLGAEADAFVWRFGLVPQVLSELPLSVPRSEGGALGALITPFSSMFLHGSWLHVISNMWFLHVFGDNIEDALGRARFVLFYLGTGLVAAACQLFYDPGSDLPMVGASGAVSGILGAYVVLYPRARVVAFVPPLFFVELPAVLFLLIWFLMQFIGLAMMGDSGDAGAIAWSAHLGGFASGWASLRVFGARTALPRETTASE